MPQSKGTEPHCPTLLTALGRDSRVAEVAVHAGVWCTPSAGGRQCPYRFQPHSLPDAGGPGVEDGVGAGRMQPLLAQGDVCKLGGIKHPHDTLVGLARARLGERFGDIVAELVIPAGVGVQQWLLSLAGVHMLDHAAHCHEPSGLHAPREGLFADKLVSVRFWLCLRSTCPPRCDPKRTPLTHTSDSQSTAPKLSRILWARSEAQEAGMVKVRRYHMRLTPAVYTAGIPAQKDADRIGTALRCLHAAAYMPQTRSFALSANDHAWSLRRDLVVVGIACWAAVSRAHLTGRTGWGRAPRSSWRGFC